jgi:RsmE family RNA methyltransferase
MNLILCEPHEVGSDGIVHVTDGRAAHVRTVLRAGVGDTLRIGIVDGPKGRGEVLAIDDRGGVTVRCEFDTPAVVTPRPAVDLLLALPRPKVLRRLWAQLAALGVGRIILTNAERVERNYFDTHVLDEATWRPLLIEGLQQACDTRLPQVSIHRQFRVLIEDELDGLSNDGTRLVAHPHADGAPSLASFVSPAPRALLAIGPEGGWNSFELALLRRHRFEPISLGPRVLRTDTACIALLALLHASLSAGRTPAAEGQTDRATR